ncbi:MAG: LicD family protein, partial [Lachnospiraceae bacterium]|nr:LicD family protein [Lachnospiraceae bacterium]
MKVDMEYSVEYFRDEVRDGFYIPTALKQAWVAQLKVLEEIDRVCKKHGIKYFADCGSLIGCVRHGGFVPWDDDLDIGMCRDDYRRFRAIADEELPEGYVIHDYERHENHWLFLARIVNRERSCFDADYLNDHYNFPWLAGIDIFLKDHLYDDKEKEKERDDEVLHIIAVADSIVAGEMDNSVKEHWLSEFEKKYGVRIDRTFDKRHLGIELYRLAELQMSRLSGRDSHTMGQIFPLIMKGHKELPDYFYERVINLPFETGTIPVTAGYHAFLLSDYIDYLSIYKQGGAHQYPFYEAQKKELLSHADFEYLEFTFDPDMTVRKPASEAYSGSLKGLAEECLGRFEELYGMVCSSDVTDEERLEALREGQQLALDLGNMVEAVKGEESEQAMAVVNALQAYCDAVYAVYVSITGETEVDCEPATGGYGQALGRYVSVACLEKCLTELKAAVDENIIKRREVVFLATGPKYWDAFQYFYEKENDENTDVYVLDLPVRFKDCYGRIKDSDDAAGDCAEAYPPQLSILPWEQYDTALHFPDRIYIQDAYDGENPCLSIPKELYSSNIRDYCSELVLVPALMPEEFTSAGIKEMHNMGAYVTVPGVVYADRVILGAEWLKERYLEKLCAWAGEETGEYWDGKIQVCLQTADEGKYKTTSAGTGDESPEAGKESEHGRHILYMIGLDGLVLRKDAFIDDLSGKLKSFTDNPDVANVSMSFYPPDKGEWMRASEKLSGKVWEIMEACAKDKHCRIVEHRDISAYDYDSY